jgi:REP element-mobilizing transposase RayT
MSKLSHMHRSPARIPLAYFITVRTYGTWFHGDSRGSVDRNHNEYRQPAVEPSVRKVASEASRLKGAPTILCAEAAALVERTIHEVCDHRRWRCIAASARSNHFHAIIFATVAPERIMNDLKARCTRLLREADLANSTQEIWAKHGSTRYLWTDSSLLAAIGYVRDGQGPRLRA